jgi:uncharacterized protein (DUF58 family)
METKDLLKKVRKIEIKTKRLSNHLFSGQYHTSFKGRGMTFSEVRQYQYGDDFRAIDWNVSAKNNDAFVKVFEEERELTLFLMIDISASQNFGSSEQNKKDIVTEIAATLAFSATQNNDKIGLLLFSDQIELFIPPKKGKSHVLRIIREMIEFKPTQNKTNISFAIDYLAAVLKKKAIVFMISDFIDADYNKKLQIASKKHDVTGIRIYDKREEQLTNVGVIQIKNPETQELQWINTNDKSVLNAYNENFRNVEAYCKNSFSKCGAGLVNIKTDESYVSKLLTYFKNRA